MQKYCNLYLACKQQQLYGPVNYRDFRETGPRFQFFPLLPCNSLGRRGGEGEGVIDLIDTVAMLNKSVFKTVSMPGGNHWVYWFLKRAPFSTNSGEVLFVKRIALREGNLYVVYSNDLVSWVGKVRVSTLDRLEKDDFSVSDTGDKEGKIPVRPIGVKPPWGTPM